ncbi:hypothetical protein HYY70_02440 [Candidatus Woesearchaeota archaeon]|nr:hypothetical protein [Candidatus Woesearchaeota archaeon]
MTSAVIPYSKRNFATLLERVSAYTDQPLGEIERLANEAVVAGILSERELVIIQYRLPFTGFKNQGYEKLRQRVGGVSSKRVPQIEDRAYEKLVRLQRAKEALKIRERNMQEFLELTIDYLPWKASNPVHTRTYNALANFNWQYKEHGLPTIREVVDYLRGLAERDEKLQMRGVWQKGFEAMYEVFKNAGIDLPEVRLGRFHYQFY